MLRLVTTLIAAALLTPALATAAPTDQLELRLMGAPLAGAGYLGGDGHGEDASGPAVGAEVGAFHGVSSWLAVGVLAGYRRSMDDAESPRDDGSLNVLTAVPTLRVGRLGTQTWGFFGEVGLGYAYLRPDDPEINAVMHTFEARLGGGVTVPLTHSFSVQGHLGVAYGAGTSDASATDDPEGYTDDVLVMQGRMLDLGVGVAYRF